MGLTETILEAYTYGVKGSFYELIPRSTDSPPPPPQGQQFVRLFAAVTFRVSASSLDKQAQQLAKDSSCSYPTVVVSLA